MSLENIFSIFSFKKYQCFFIIYIHKIQACKYALKASGTWFWVKLIHWMKWVIQTIEIIILNADLYTTGKGYKIKHIL